MKHIRKNELIPSDRFTLFSAQNTLQYTWAPFKCNWAPFKGTWAPFKCTWAPLKCTWALFNFLKCTWAPFKCAWAPLKCTWAPFEQAKTVSRIYLIKRNVYAQCSNRIVAFCLNLFLIIL